MITLKENDNQFLRPVSSLSRVKIGCANMHLLSFNVQCPEVKKKSVKSAREETTSLSYGLRSKKWGRRVFNITMETRDDLQEKKKRPHNHFDGTFFLRLRSDSSIFFFSPFCTPHLIPMKIVRERKNVEITPFEKILSVLHMSLHDAILRRKNETHRRGSTLNGCFEPWVRKEETWEAWISGSLFSVTFNHINFQVSWKRELGGKKRENVLPWRNLEAKNEWKEGRP